MRNLIVYPNPILSMKAIPYGEKEKISPTLISDMLQIMYDYGGVGLSGPQVGVSKRIIIFVDPAKNEYTCLINPEFFPIEDTMEYSDEGCLSCPNVYGPIYRYKKIHIIGETSKRKKIEFDGEGLIARIIQHEVDHLNGITLLDRMDVITRFSQQSV